MEESEAVDRLNQVEHIIVLMMENRSFDHMLGYLSLPAAEQGSGRGDVDGLRGREVDVNYVDGEPCPIKPFGEATLTKPQDPCHSGWCVGQQMANGMAGFAENYASTRVTNDPSEIMRYQTAANVPLYDWISRQYAISDRWFCSVPGSTWPNRLASLTGYADSKDNRLPPIYSHPAFVRGLDERYTWRWYSSDPGSLRLADSAYRTGSHESFAYVEKPSLVQHRTLYTDLFDEDDFPNVAWIDPNFVDLGGLHGADDDHPPTDVMAGQSFVLKIYETLARSAIWKKSLFVIVYDEHGGFYDHVDPSTGLPDDFASRAQYSHFGPRVPALFISPFVQPGRCFGSQDAGDAAYCFDHTALIKTILQRFGRETDRFGVFEDPGARDRIEKSSHLGHVLTADTPMAVAPMPGEDEVVQPVIEWWGRHIGERLRRPVADIPALAELGVVAEVTGAQGVAQAGWDVVNWIKDRVSRLLGRGPRKPKPAEAKPEAAAVQPTRGTEMLDGSELERGVVLAAKVIRSGPDGLPSGQP